MGRYWYVFRHRHRTAKLMSFPWSHVDPTGICLVLVGHPLDLIKVKMQTGNHFKSIADVGFKTLRHEGVSLTSNRVFN